jgi:hypothetical protein
LSISGLGGSADFGLDTGNPNPEAGTGFPADFFPAKNRPRSLASGLGLRCDASPTSPSSLRNGSDVSICDVSLRDATVCDVSLLRDAFASFVANGLKSGF